MVGDGRAKQPQLVYALRQEPQLAQSTAAVLRALPSLLQDRDVRLPDALIGHVRRILQQLREVGSRQVRIDARRALDVLTHLQGKTAREAIELLSSVEPGRTPRPAKDISHLLDPGLPVPKSVLQPLTPSRSAGRGPDGADT